MSQCCLCRSLANFWNKAHVYGTFSLLFLFKYVFFSLSVKRLTAVTLLLGEWRGPGRIYPSPAAEGLSRWTPPAAATLAEPPRAAEQGSSRPTTTQTTSHKARSGSWTPTVMKTTVTMDRHLPLPSLCPQSVIAHYFVKLGYWQHFSICTCCPYLLQYITLCTLGP